MNGKQDAGSHLFMVRLWNEEAPEATDGKEWRGRVQHVLSGEARTFDNWAMLIDLLLEMAETDGIETRVPGGTTREAIQ